ncbi:hypothetical protein [Streptococcus halichoeri]|uniref:hypothetical protein n=1 Tax=Streptococcus halichoeri TaxID=254785 RepID=UPI0013585506|nr:hypothetical protein [Streptococcus halichoeri]
MKKLLMVVAMCLAFCAVAVNAEGRKWEKVPDQQKVTDDNRQPISVNIENGDGDNENKIKITLPPGWSVWFDKGNGPYTPIKIGDRPFTDYKEKSGATGGGVEGKPNTSPRVIVSNKEENPQLGFIYNDNHGEGGLPITVTVASPTDSEDKLTVSLRGEDGLFAGSIFLRDSQGLAEEKLNQDMEKMYLEYIKYDNSKTWYQRLGDGIRDQWWNFTGMFY